MTLAIQIQAQHFTMHPTGVLFWEDEAMLIISDVHLGKVAHFRKFGAAVPHNLAQENFALLQGVVAFFRPQVICFLGDLFHSSLNIEWALFEQWVSRTSANIVLVQGNHDIISPLKYEALGIAVVSELVQKGFLLTHHPEERNGFFNLSGHVHPAIRLKGTAQQSLRLACFFKREHQMILPAFGKFTGTHVLKPGKKDEIFALAAGKVIKI